MIFWKWKFCQKCFEICRIFGIKLIKINLIGNSLSIFENRKKVVNHSTLTLNSQVGMVWADCYNHQPTTIHLGRVLSVTNQSCESAVFSIPLPCGIQYRVTHIHTHCTGWIPNIFYAFLNILKSWTILLECMNTVL